MNANADVCAGPGLGRFQRVSRLAWPLCFVAVAAALGVVILDVLDRARIHSFHDVQPVGIVLPVSFSLLGAIIVSRQPGNRIGWIFLLIGVLMPWQALGALYFERSVISGGLPGARWAAWYPQCTSGRPASRIPAPAATSPSRSRTARGSA